MFRIKQRNAADVPLSKSEFAYDYASRRAWSREYVHNGTSWVQTDEKRRVFDGMDVIQERDATNQITAQLVRDGNIGGILSRRTGAGDTFYGYDGNGNVTLLTNSAGQDVGHYRYDAFGNTLEAEGPRAGENPYRFSTKELHGPSGLYDYGLRFYSPGMGRWMNRDPLEEEGGVNLYEMVENNPVNSVDEYGLIVVDKNGYPIDLTYQTDPIDSKLAATATMAANNNATAGGGLIAAGVATVGRFIYRTVRNAARNRRSNSPVINTQKQAGHIPRTPQNKVRNTPNKQGKVKSTSTFYNKASGRRLTEEAWRKGKPVNGNENVRLYDFKRPVGRGPKGGTQTKVRVSRDTKGRIHGTPWGSITP